jgi:uncharacterized protein YlzI (FlbEa/FlbD family)
MHYIIYETTNLINGKKYIGKHKTSNLDDNYLGSGLYLQKSIQKYGRENFERKVLFVFDNENEMEEKEKELVNSELIRNDQYYNISLGGQGGITVLYEEHPAYEETCQKISIGRKNKSEKLSVICKQLHKQRKIGMYGKKQSDNQKRIVSEKLSGVPKKIESVNKQKESLHKTLNTEGYVHPNTGKKKPVKQCPYCSRVIDLGNFARYHGDKCKHRTLDMAH